MREEHYFLPIKIIRFLSKYLSIIIPIKKSRIKLKGLIYRNLTDIYNALFGWLFRQPSEFRIYADFIMSAGPACKSAHYLQNFSLRKISSPLDWMMNYKLSEINEMFENDFKKFFIDIEINKEGGGSR